MSCERCGDHEEAQTFGLGAESFSDISIIVELCRDCRSAWTELWFTDKEMVRYRKIENMLEALEYVDNVDLSRVATLLDEREGLVKSIYFTAKGFIANGSRDSD